MPWIDAGICFHKVRIVYICLLPLAISFAPLAHNMGDTVEIYTLRKKFKKFLSLLR